MFEKIKKPENKKRSLLEIDSFSGREIAGIRPVEERFKILTEGEDLELVSLNELVFCDREITDFFMFVSPSLGEVKRVIEAPHWRAVSTEGVHASLKLSDDRSEPFYCVNTKGPGYLKATAKGFNIEDYDSWAIHDKDGVNDRGFKVLGLISMEEALKGTLFDKSIMLASQGLRTEIYWGIAKVLRLPFKGQMLDVETLRERKVISPRKSYHPSQVIRLLKINNRIAEVHDAEDRRLDLFKRAFEVFNLETKDKGLDFPELDINNPEHQRIFFSEFFRRMGNNLAIMINHGYDHGYLHSANITLAAEIVDIGTIENWRDEENIVNQKKFNGIRRATLKDMRDVAYGLRMLVRAGKAAGLGVGSTEILRESFFSGFESLYNEKMSKSQRSDPNNVREWLAKIYDAVVVRKENLPSLLHNEVTDWHIYNG